MRIDLRAFAIATIAMLATFWTPSAEADTFEVTGSTLANCMACDPLSYDLLITTGTPFDFVWAVKSDQVISVTGITGQIGTLSIAEGTGLLYESRTWVTGDTFNWGLVPSMAWTGSWQPLWMALPCFSMEAQTSSALEVIRIALKSMLLGLQPRGLTYRGTL